MVRSLRGLFVLSHVLPLLVAMPLVGLALVYVLETQIMLETLAAELETQALLVSSMASARAELWHDAVQARSFVASMERSVSARVTLVRLDGTMVSSGGAADGPGDERAVEPVAWSAVTSGQTTVLLPHGLVRREQSVDVLVPVRGPDGRVVGVIRLSYLVDSLKQRFVRNRALIAGVLSGGLLVGVIAGVVLAANLERPLRQITHAVSALADGEPLDPLAERGAHEVRLLVRAVNTLVERLQSLERARRKLLANLVHELSRPLGAFRSAIQALLRGADEDPALRRELLIGMEQEVGRMRRLLDDLATLHDRTLGAIELDCRETDLNEWLARTLGPWREAARAKGQRWQVDLPTPLPALEVDPDRLGQALGNLLSNAIKYTPPGGTVSVRAGLEPEAVWIEVGDTGPGLAPQEQAHILEPLYRSHADRRFPQGMGLGLSIAHDLIVAHGGQLDIDSAPGQGSRFTLWIPRDPQPANGQCVR
jgi:two-component system sensor histidine kinase BaeS